MVGRAKLLWKKILVNFSNSSRNLKISSLKLCPTSKFPPNFVLETVLILFSRTWNIHNTENLELQIRELEVLRMVSHYHWLTLEFGLGIIYTKQEYLHKNQSALILVLHGITAQYHENTKKYNGNSLVEWFSVAFDFYT